MDTENVTRTDRWALPVARENTAWQGIAVSSTVRKYRNRLRVNWQPWAIIKAKIGNEIRPRIRRILACGNKISPM